jgi:hypothetical protein
MIMRSRIHDSMQELPASWCFVGFVLGFFAGVTWALVVV